MDPYTVLGVSPGADVQTIRRAYRRLARRYHPDVGGSNAAMSQLNAARAALERLGGAPSCTDARPRSAPPATARAEPLRRRPRRADAVGAAGRQWTGRVRRWAIGRRSGQWSVTVAVVLAVHAIAQFDAAVLATAGSPELLTMALAMAVQASATPRGRPFAPANDAGVALRLVGRLTWTVSRLVIGEASRCAAGRRATAGDGRCW